MAEMNSVICYAQILQNELLRTKPIVQDDPTWAQNYNVAFAYMMSAVGNMEKAIAMLQAIHSELGEDEAE